MLDEVLALVIDSAIELSRAERGFIMLADPSGRLEFKLARARGKVTLPGKTFETSRKIPEEVFTTGEIRLVADLLDGDLPAVHTGTIALGIRHVFCIPLRLVRYVDEADASTEQKRIGVLYLDSRERGTLASSPLRAGMETLATEAAVAIENARLYREAVEKARMEQELRIAAEIQQSLLPPPRVEAGLLRGARPLGAVPRHRRRLLRVPDVRGRRVGLRGGRCLGQGRAGGAAHRGDPGHPRRADDLRRRPRHDALAHQRGPDSPGHRAPGS